ncbi:hypothetical protein SBC1_18160 [Caballeronia sp. SBC1]|nr:hypothetical protein SBC2_19540 [Caballeronia sp. SBC2]QIN61821.1 hypothetical protein SBC1_18160 [Caballeronia sp. SBC1]
MSTACSSDTWVRQKHGTRQSDGCVNPSFSEHGYPHASPPVTEPAKGAPRAIRGQPSTEFVCTPNHVANPLQNKAAKKMREAVTHEDNHADHIANPPRGEAVKTRQAVCVHWQGCLPESVGGEACSCQDSREGGVHTSVALASTVLLGYQKHENCTLGTLTSPRFESAFFASFLCRFGQRNDAPPRAVANSDKENSQHITREGPESSNPALTPTANPGTWHPCTDPNRYRRNLTT